MSTIPQAEIDRIKQNYAIRPVVSRWIELDKNGRACCPFHQEKSPSFKVSEDGYYKCFGCGAGGDVISFVQTYKAVSFKEACEIITGHVIEPERTSFKNGRIIMLSDRMAEGPEETPKAKPVKITVNKFQALWVAKVENFTDEYADSVALNRGLDGRIFRWLKEQGLIGLHNSKHVAFPMHDDAGNVVRCHVKDHDKDTWYYEPHCNSDKGTQSLIIGDTKVAKTTFILESQWDAFAIMSALQHWDHENDYAYIITRGASSNTDVSKHVTSQGRTILIPQNDPEDKKDATGKTPAEKWLERCKASIPVNVTAYVAATPKEYEDPNDWIAKASPSENDVKKQFTELIHTPESNPNTPLKFECVHHTEMGGMEAAFDFVEDLFTDGALSVVWGGPGTGKTFAVLSIGASIATGRDWHGKEVEQGAVIYVALEGMQGAVNRIQAMQIRGILPPEAPLYLCFAPVDLLNPAHPEAVIRMVEEKTKQAGIPVRFVILDTLARSMPNGDETSGEDMGVAVQSMDKIRIATKSHVCVIHHCGKDAARGERGHSSLRGAVDTSIEVTHPDPADKYRVFTVRKQRDLEMIPPLCFSLEPVVVGINRRGKEITSCVAKEEDEIMAQATKKKSGAKKQFTTEMILKLLPQPSVKHWLEAAAESYKMSSDTFGNRKRECASLWEKVGNQIVLKPLQNKEKWDNGGIDF